MPVPARFLVLMVLSASAPALFADTVTLSSNGGTMTLGNSFHVAAAAVANPAGTLSLDCPITNVASGTYQITYTCSGGSVDFTSSDGTSVLSASFSTGTLTYSGSGGGRGNPSKYYYEFSGNFSGTWTRNGVSEAIIGGTYQSIGPLHAQIGSGSAPVSYGGAGAIPAYTPFYFTTGSQVWRSSDLAGTDLVAYGATGTGTGQFYGAAGVALDASGRIYVADTINSRIVRIDDLTGKNWTTFGVQGSGTGQFSAPNGLAIDSAGRIYVADSSNNRIVRIDDMSGANWVSYGAAGAGTGQFSHPLSVAVDATGRIYVPDNGNSRIVRIDDMTGANWIALTQSPNLGGYIYLIQLPVAVAFDPSGRIFIGEQSNGTGSTIIRIDDMTGTNWTAIYSGNNLNGMSADSSGNVFASGDSIAAIEGFGFAGTLSTVFGASSGIAMAPVPSPVPPAVRISPSSLQYANQNTGTSSASQTVTLTNFGGSPLVLSSIGASGDFSAANNCGSSLPGGQNCTATVVFAPVATGVRTGALKFSDNSANEGASQSVALSGTGTKPVLSIAPSGLSFAPQVLNTTSAAQQIIVSNTGTGPLNITNVIKSGDFAQTNNCGASLQPGTSCAMLVTFTPIATGARTGFVALADNLGTQGVALGGTGATTAPAVTVSAGSLVFPGQLVSTASAAQSVTLANAGSTAVAVSGIKTSGDYSDTTTCSTSLRAHGTCSIKVTFKPTTPGIRPGALTLTLSTGTLTVGLTGTGDTSTTPPSLTLSTNTLSFAGYIVGDNPTQSITVTNSNGVTAGIAGVGLTGTPPFHLSKNCGSTLAAGATCTVAVTFVPLVAGSFSGALAIKESSGAFHLVSITGSASTSGGGGN